MSRDVSAGFDRTLILTRPEEVCAAVEQWLAEILASVADERMAPGAPPDDAREIVPAAPGG